MSAPARLRLARPAPLDLRQQEKGKEKGVQQSCSNWTRVSWLITPAYHLSAGQQVQHGCPAVVAEPPQAQGGKLAIARGSPVQPPCCCQALLQISNQLIIPGILLLAQAVSLARLATCARGVLAAGALI